MGVLDELNRELAALVDGAAPAVVALTGRRRDLRSAGSGFALAPDRAIVTSWHVVEGLGPPITATLAGGVRRAVTVGGHDEITDLAVLRLEGPPAGCALTLREEPARLGEICLVIGSPFGAYPESVSQGVVSGLARTVRRPGLRPIEDAVQTDAAINPGNSGGPVLDVRGRVLGVAIGIDTRARGIGFAVPADTVRWVVGELVAHGRVARGALGVGVGTRSFVLRDRSEVRPVVRQVTRGGPADGVLRAGDVILRVNGRVVRGPGDLHRALTRDTIGRPTEVELLRDGNVGKVEIRPVELTSSAMSRV